MWQSSTKIRLHNVLANHHVPEDYIPLSVSTRHPATDTDEECNFNLREAAETVSGCLGCVAFAHPGHMDKDDIVATDSTQRVRVMVVCAACTRNIIFVPAAVEEILDGLSLNRQGAKDGDADMIRARGTMRYFRAFVVLAPLSRVRALLYLDGVSFPLGDI